MISGEDRAMLESWTRSRSIRASHVERARIVLAVADGKGTSGVALEVGVSWPTVIKWRDRLAEHGLAGLDDEPRPGRPKTVDDSAIVAATLEPPPQRLGVTHPQLEAKVRDVVGLLLSPPEKAVVLCVDEKSQIQALNRTAPILLLRPGLPEKATHDYRRNGTTTLFAALEVATGKVVDERYDRHGKAEFLDFLKTVAKAYPRRELHVVLDNYHTHKHDEINAWLTKHPRITLHFTPTSGSWLNLVEVFFGIITKQAIRRGSFDSVKELVAAIRTFIECWNERCHPFIWTKTADQILHATRKPNSDAGH